MTTHNLQYVSPPLNGVMLQEITSSQRLVVPGPYTIFEVKSAKARWLATPTADSLKASM